MKTGKNGHYAKVIVFGKWSVSVKNKFAKNMRKTIPQADRVVLYKKRILNTANIWKNETILKNGHYAKATAFGKWSLSVKR